MVYSRLEAYTDEAIDAFLSDCAQKFGNDVTFNQMMQFIGVIVALGVRIDPPSGVYPGVHATMIEDGDLVAEIAWSGGRLSFWFDKVPEDSLLVIVDGTAIDKGELDVSNVSIGFDNYDNVANIAWDSLVRIYGKASQIAS